MNIANRLKEFVEGIAIVVMMIVFLSLALGVVILGTITFGIINLMHKITRKGSPEKCVIDMKHDGSGAWEEK